MAKIEQHQAREFYNLVYDGERYGSLTPAELAKLRKVLEERVEKQDIVLEIGAGRGLASDAAIRYIGIDISERALRQHPRIGWIGCADAERLPFKSGSVPFVFTLATLARLCTSQ
jgi:cyclopropane fatty-acyl-phospholipid synthase-like methyltransferase